MREKPSGIPAAEFMATFSSHREASGTRARLDLQVATLDRLIAEIEASPAVPVTAEELDALRVVKGLVGDDWRRALQRWWDQGTVTSHMGFTRAADLVRALKHRQGLDLGKVRL